jgi:hypothetical protein
MDIMRIEMMMLEPRCGVFIRKTGEYIYEKELLLVEFAVEHILKGCHVIHLSTGFKL